MEKIEEYEKLKAKNIMLERKVSELKNNEEILKKQNKIVQVKLDEALTWNPEVLQDELKQKSSDIEEKDAKINVLQWELKHMKDSHDRLYKECRDMVGDKIKNEKQAPTSEAKTVEDVKP